MHTACGRPFECSSSGSKRRRGQAHRFPDRARTLPPLEAEVRRRGGRAADGRRRECRPVRRLPAEAQLLRPGRRHRARRCRAAAALRAPRGEGGGAQVRQGPRVLRRRQHPHAGRLHPCAQGQLLQVHQRDAQRHGGRQRQLGPEVHVCRARHCRRRRLRAGAGDRPHHARRRRQFLRGAARAAAARRAAGHRRPHARHRQAQGAPRSRRCLLHGRGRRARDPRGEVAARRPDRAQLQVRRRREGRGQEARSASRTGRPMPRASR